VTRVVCVSDLHENWVEMPEGDLLLIAGDLTFGFKHDYVSQQKTIINEFLPWALDQPAEKVVCVAGNHDQSVEKWGWPIVPSSSEKLIYLQDAGVDVCGFRIWGTPWQPWFYNWGFNAPKRGGERFLKERFDLIPDETDIIICHGPPYSYGDHEVDGMYESLGYGQTPKRSGSKALAAAVRRVDPLLMVCGHIHQGYGVYNVHGKQTKIANAALVNYEYKPVNEPLVFDIEDGKVTAVNTPSRS